LNHTRKISKHLFSPGGHIGPPGEATGYDYSRNIPKNTLFAVQSYN